MKNPAEERQLSKPMAAARDYSIMFIGAVIYSASMVMFLRPAKVPVGGLTGIAMITNYFFEWPLGLQTIIMNIPLFLWSWKVLGRNFVVRSGFAMLATSLLMDAFAPIIPAFEGDRLLSAIFGGVTHGIGMGIIFSRGGTTGGTDIVSKIVNVKTGRSIGNLLLAMNSVIICAASFAYGDGELNASITVILYAVVMQALASYAIDSMLGGMDSGNAAFIVTEKPEEIAQAVFDNLGRGVTAMDAEGMFSHSKKTTLLCAIRNHEALALKNAVKGADPAAFMIMTNAKEVVGRGFTAPSSKNNSKKLKKK